MLGVARDRGNFFSAWQVQRSLVPAGDELHGVDEFAPPGGAEGFAEQIIWPKI